MDFSDPRQLAVFFDVHNQLPREGPGSRESTSRALSIAGSLLDNPDILDIACGPGAQTIDLASLLPRSVITALDLNKSMVKEADRRIQSAGVTDRVTIEIGNMDSLGYADAAFDLLWCEGAAYIIGVKNALTLWKRTLRPGGKIALTEAVWLKPNPPPALTEFWSDYPDMNTIDNRRNLIRQCGYRLLGDFVLPESAWWDDYYGPMHSRLEMLKNKYEGDDIAIQVINGCFDEITFYKKYADYYGYVFLIMSI